MVNQIVELIWIKTNMLPSPPLPLPFLLGYFYDLVHQVATQMLVQAQRKGRSEQLRESGKFD